MLGVVYDTGTCCSNEARYILQAPNGLVWLICETHKTQMQWHLPVFEITGLRPLKYPEEYREGG